jgi:methyl-accepting chemotaxis protein
MKFLSKLSFKIPFLVMLSCMACSIGVAVIVAFSVKDVLVSNYERNFVQILESKKLQLSQYFDGVKSDINVMSSNGQVVNAAHELITARFANLSSADVIHRKFTSESPYLLSQRDKLVTVVDSEPYFALHTKYHPWFKEFMSGKGYNDIMIIDTNGNIAYTVAKDADFGINVKSDKWKNTDLAKAYYSAISAKPESEPVFFDFRRYEISGNLPVSFVAKQITNQSGQIIGALVLEIPVKKLNQIMDVSLSSNYNGLYYAVGQDFLLRNDLPNIQESTSMTKRIEGDHINMALTGNTQSMYSKGITGTDVFTSYVPFELNNIKWALVAEVDKFALLKPIRELQYKIFFICFASIMLIGGAGFVLAQKTSKPLRELIDQMRQLEKGNTSFRVRYTELNGEVGDMAKSLSSFRETAISMRGKQDEKENEKIFKDERARKITSLVRDFEARSAQTLEAITATASKLQDTAEALSTIIKKAAAQSNTATSATGQANQNLENIVSATDGMSRYVEHIATQIANSKQAVDSAVSKTRNADSETSLLNNASKEIGNFIQVIQNIAEQINLLSLNATIESARAGDAGKGFAVVASEVKTLAQQTKNATHDISNQIGNVQDISKKVIEVLGSISESIGGMNQSSAGIVSAFVEQKQIANKIVSNAKNASDTFSDVNQNLSGLNDVINKTAASTSEVLSAAKNLGKEAESLSQEIQMLLSNLQSA